jgi:YbbR domain-containing protein
MDRLLERDPVVRILSVVLAVLLWFLGTNQQNPITQRTVVLPLQHNAVGAGLMLMDLTPRTVTVTVQGRQSIVELLSESDFAARADLSAAGSGRVKLPVEIEVRPRAVQVVDYTPHQAEAVIDKIETRVVPVQVRVAGNPHPDHEAATARLSTATVSVTGAQSVVETVNRVTAVVDIEGATASVVRTVSLRPEDFAGREVRDIVVEPAQVEVTVPLTALPPSKTLPVKPALSGKPEPGFRVGEITVEPSFVTVRAPASVISRIDVLGTTPVSIEGRSESFTAQVELVIPAGVEWQSHSKVDVAVTMVEDVVDRQFNAIPILPRHLTPGYVWDMEPQALDVRLEGRKDLIDKLTAGMITAYVDAMWREEGEHRLPITVEVPDGIRLVQAIPNQVTLRLSRR